MRRIEFLLRESVWFDLVWSGTSDPDSLIRSESLWRFFGGAASNLKHLLAASDERPFKRRPPESCFHFSDDSQKLRAFFLLILFVLLKKKRKTERWISFIGGAEAGCGRLKKRIKKGFLQSFESARCCRGYGWIICIHLSHVHTSSAWTFCLSREHHF